MIVGLVSWDFTCLTHQHMGMIGPNNHTFYMLNKLTMANKIFLQHPWQKRVLLQHPWQNTAANNPPLWCPNSLAQQWTACGTPSSRYPRNFQSHDHWTWNQSGSRAPSTQKRALCWRDPCWPWSWSVICSRQVHTLAVWHRGRGTQSLRPPSRGGSQHASRPPLQFPRFRRWRCSKGTASATLAAHPRLPLQDAHGSEAPVHGRALVGSQTRVPRTSSWWILLWPDQELVPQTGQAMSVELQISSPSSHWWNARWWEHLAAKDEWASARKGLQSSHTCRWSSML